MSGFQDSFRTKIILDKRKTDISHHSRLLFLGSCFAEHIGQKCLDHGFRTVVNPVGIYYDPLALREIILLALRQMPLRVEDFQFDGQTYFHWALHGDFRGPHAKPLVDDANDALVQLHEAILSADVLFMSLGSAIVFEHIETGLSVANCHRQPQALFRRKPLDHESCVSALYDIGASLRKANKELRVVYTVSPVRHIRHGMVQNALSKSRLISSVHSVISQQSDTEYFASYEIMMDDLRDYRYYTKDMLHPSELAVDYIWSQFSQVYFDDFTSGINDRIASIRARQLHQPRYPGSASHQKFLTKLDSDIKKLKTEYPQVQI